MKCPWCKKRLSWFTSRKLMHVFRKHLMSEDVDEIQRNFTEAVKAGYEAFKSKLEVPE